MHDVAVSLSRLSYFLTHLPLQNARYRDSLQAILLPSDKAGLPLIVFKEVKNIRFYEGDHNDWDPDTGFVGQLYKRWENSKKHILSLPKTGLEATSATCPTEMNSFTSPRRGTTQKSFGKRIIPSISIAIWQVMSAIGDTRVNLFIPECEKLPSGRPKQVPRCRYLSYHSVRSCHCCRSDHCYQNNPIIASRVAYFVAISVPPPQPQPTASIP